MDYRILGPLEVHADGEPVAVGGRRQRALLALLLLDANRVVSRTRLIDALWEDGADDHALRVCISRLRKVLGNDAIDTRTPGYRLHVAPGELDLDRFRQLVEDSRAPEDPVPLLRAAERLWRGPPLADLEDERFANAEIGPLADLLPSAIEERVAAELALGRHAALVPELEALVEAYPLRERLRAQAMLALYRAGRQADALAAYRAGRVRLVEELGLNPGRELVALETAILRHDPALDLPAPPPRPAARRRRRLALPVIASLAVAAGVLAITLPDGGSRAAPSPIRGNAAALFGAHGATAATTLGAAPSRAVAGVGSLLVTHRPAGAGARGGPKTRPGRPTAGGGAGPPGVAVADPA